MLGNQIEKFAQVLTECIPLPIFIYNDKEDGGFCGVTDTIDNYGYIRCPTSRKKYSYEDTDICDYEKVTAQYTLIIDLSKKIDSHKAHALIRSKIHEASVECGLILKLISSGDDNDEIYKNETADDGFKDCKHNLICYDFSLTDDCSCRCDDEGCLTDLM